MKGEERRQKIIDGTMRVIAEKGLDTFSVIQVARKTHINEALIYRDFETKDNLLMSCYYSYQNKVANLYREISAKNSMKPLKENLYEVWYAAFCFMVDEDYRTIFAHAFRESSYREALMNEEKQGKPDYLYEAREKWLGEKFNQDINMSFIWTYVIDLSMEFAVRIIRGEFTYDEENIMQIWNLMFGGISSLILKDSSN